MDIINTNTLGGQIKYNIVKNDISYTELSELLEIQIRTIHRWENNLEVPRKKCYRKLEEIFKLKL